MIVNFKYTETFISSLKELGIGRKQANLLLEKYEKHLHPFPECCSIPEYLQDIGVTRYRGYLSPENYTILYTYEIAENTIISHAIIHQRQDMMRLLFNRMIER
ncbi:MULTISPECIES: hypothetical protein [Providencia]|jgi:hypothetical protein|uniref:hypothetical protein n=1 Tax=Providencia TaxID=586 RepID=UPI002361640D|nr:hypothetical protein [Providencia rettgeri]ELR5150674.1 hypothetical protein [Providencia rettgeri]MDR2227705.1 hypothetical protein [Providencia sp.]